MWITRARSLIYYYSGVVSPKMCDSGCETGFDFLNENSWKCLIYVISKMSFLRSRHLRAKPNWISFMPCRFFVIFRYYISDFLELILYNLVNFVCQKQYQVVSNIKIYTMNQWFSSVRIRNGVLPFHILRLFLHVFSIFIFSAFPLFFIPTLTRPAAPASHQHQCLGSAGSVTRTSARGCACCESSAFRVFIFHHCKWSVLDVIMSCYLFSASLWRELGWCHYLRNGSEVSPPPPPPSLTV